jgi:hypothetical protein
MNEKRILGESNSVVILSFDMISMGFVKLARKKILDWGLRNQEEYLEEIKAG